MRIVLESKIMYKQLTAVTDKELADKLTDQVIIPDKWILKILRDSDELEDASKISGSQVYAFIEANVHDDVVQSIISQQITDITKGYIFGLMGIKKE